MDDRNLYRDTFSQVRYRGRTVCLEDIKMRKRHGTFHKGLLLAAVLALLAAFAVTAYATGLFGLRNFLLPPSQPSRRTGGPAVSDPDFEPDPYAIAQKDILSLQGYSNTPEAMAAGEWLQFQNTYDPDGAIISAIGNSLTGLEEEYGLYTVYTQEMADELERILAKYRLQKHTEILLFEDDAALLAALSKDGRPFFSGEHSAYSAYMYEDGTFHYDGEFYGPEGVFSYQCMRCMRGSFTDVFLSIGDVDAYTEWAYETAAGMTVTLALGPKLSLILAETEDAFITFNLLTGTEGNFDARPIGKETMEQFADSIDWRVLQEKPVLPGGGEPVVSAAAEAEMEKLLGEYRYVSDAGTGRLTIGKGASGYDISDYPSPGSYRFLADSSNIEAIEDHRIAIKYPEQVFSDGAERFGYYTLEYGIDGIYVYYRKPDSDEGRYLYHAAKNGGAEAYVYPEEFSLGENLKAAIVQLALCYERFDRDLVSSRGWEEIFIGRFIQNSRLSFDYLEEASQWNRGEIGTEELGYIHYSLTGAALAFDTSVNRYNSTSALRHGWISGWTHEATENGVRLTADLTAGTEGSDATEEYTVTVELERNPYSCFDGYSIVSLSTEAKG